MSRFRSFSSREGGGDRRADTDLNWRRGLAKPEPPKPEPKPVSPRYSAPAAPWANAAPQAPAVDEAAFPNLNAEPTEPEPTEPEPTIPEKNPWGVQARAADESQDPLWPSLATPPPPPKTPPKKSPVKQPGANPHKPKPQTSYSIFDAVKVVKKDAVKVVKKDAPKKPQVEEEKKKPPPLDPGEEVKPKKRKLSSLKKRILVERFEMLKSRGGDDEKKDEEVTRIRLLNGARVEEVEDEDERDEVLRDVEEMCGALGAKPITVALGETLKEEYVVIEVTFDSVEAALGVARGLRGRILGGETLALEVRSNDELLAVEDGVTEMLVQAQEIRLVGVVSEDDRLRILEDDEELDEIIEDLRDLVTSKAEVTVVAVDVVAATGDAVVSLETTDKAEAQRAVDVLATVSLQGDPVQARLNERTQIILRSICDAEILEDEEELTETVSDLANICRRKLNDFNEGRGDFVNAVTIVKEEKDRLEVGDAVLETKLDGALALQALEGLVLGGVTIDLSVLTAGDQATSLLQTKKKDPEPLLITAKKTGRIIKIPAKYAEAYSASRQHKVRRSYPRNYAATYQPMDQELDDIVMELLGKLHEFQSRLRMHDPLKAKMRQRLVLGLRQVKRGVKAENVKLVVLAPNMDESTTLDENVQDLVSLAKENDIPVIFALTKTRLGRVLKKRVDVAAVGIYSADGANDDFRRLLKRRKLLLSNPSVAVDPRDHQKALKFAAKVAEKAQKADKKAADDARAALKQQQRSKKNAPPPPVIEEPAPLSWSSVVRGHEEDTRTPRSTLTATAPAWSLPAPPPPPSEDFSPPTLSAVTPVFLPANPLPFPFPPQPMPPLYGQYWPTS